MQQQRILYWAVIVFLSIQTSFAGVPFITYVNNTYSTNAGANKICPKPAAAPTNLQLLVNGNQVSGWFTATSVASNNYLILYSTSPLLTALPVDGITYTPGNTLGNATIVNTGAATSFFVPNLNTSTRYYFFVFSYATGCTTGVGYLTTKYLSGSATTSSTNLYNNYYGNLHAHTSYSDGGKDSSTLTPANAYAFAQNSLCMDFLGISEHNHGGAGMHISDWQPGITQANVATFSNFLALYGMEWGVTSNGGHVLVYGTDKLIGWENNNYQLYVAKSDYLGSNGLFRTINKLPYPALAMLAHPGQTDYNYLDTASYLPFADSAIVGCALENGPAFATAIDYTAPKQNMEYLWYYNLMLSKGYHLAPTIDHDNHYTTFGRTAYSRLVVMSPTLSRADFFDALKNRRFYATEDCDTRASIWVNNQPMGSIFKGTTPPAISVYATDPTNPTSKPAIKIMYGVAGSKVLPITLVSGSGNVMNFTHTGAPTDAEVYYYADIKIGTNRTITAPVWYTQSSTPLPLYLSGFTINVNQVQQASLSWQSGTGEATSFSIEKSLDGTRFYEIGSVIATNAALYKFSDMQTLNGNTYYRIKLQLKDGRIIYSGILPVLLNGMAQKLSVKVAPNPIKHQQLSLQIQSTLREQAQYRLINAVGQQVWQSEQTIYKGFSQQNIVLPASLPSGTYTLQISSSSILESVKVQVD